MIHITGVSISKIDDPKLSEFVHPNGQRMDSALEEMDLEPGRYRVIMAAPDREYVTTFKVT